VKLLALSDLLAGELHDVRHGNPPGL
jgi:hypothetical protein